MVKVPHLQTVQEFRKPAEFYQQTFSELDVVWGDMRSGTVEYVADTAGFRYSWGTASARLKVIRFLRAKGYQQAIHLDDDKVSRTSVLEELKTGSIPFEERRTRLGSLVLIKP